MRIVNTFKGLEDLIHEVVEENNIPYKKNYSVDEVCELVLNLSYNSSYNRINSYLSKKRSKKQSYYNRIHPNTVIFNHVVDGLKNYSNNKVKCVLPEKLKEAVRFKKMIEQNIVSKDKVGYKRLKNHSCVEKTPVLFFKPGLTNVKIKKRVKKACHELFRNEKKPKMKKIENQKTLCQYNINLLKYYDIDSNNLW